MMDSFIVYIGLALFALAIFAMLQFALYRDRKKAETER